LLVAGCWLLELVAGCSAGCWLLVLVAGAGCWCWLLVLVLVLGVERHTGSRLKAAG
jgi:hypothetical protein